jgi:hypothetical protein
VSSARFVLRVLLPLGAGALSCGSGPDPSQGGLVVVVPVDGASSVSVNGNSGNSSGNEYTQSFALGSVADYASFGGNLARLRFDGSGSTLGAFNLNSATLDLAVAESDGSVWWVSQGMGQCSMASQSGQAFGLWTSSDSAFLTVSGTSAPVAQFCPIVTGASTSTGAAGVYGLAVDARWAFVAVGFPVQGSGSGNVGVPDAQGWPGSSPPLTAAAGSLLRFDRQNPTTPLAPLGGVTQLAVAVTSHVLSQNTLEVYWLDASGTGDDRVMRAAKDPWTTGKVLGTAKASTLTGLASNDQVAVWTVSGPPVLGATGCTVFASQADGPPVKIYDGHAAPFLCWGAAVDDKYAYFTTTQVTQQPNYGGGGSPPTYMEGTGIGRVPLAGGALQTVPLSSSRWYGPRRVKVDAQYVYAIDPSFVARVDKSAFGP